MSQKDFDKLSDAEKIEFLQKALEAANLENSNKDALIKDQEAQIATLTQGVLDAQKIATDAVAIANNTANATPGEVTIKVDKKTYIVNFGVDGLTKEEVSQDTDLVKRLVKIGSGALSLKEG
jgi:hypothetical protein